MGRLTVLKADEALSAVVARCLLLLVEAGAQDLVACHLASGLDTTQSNLSFHLKN